MLPVLLRLGLRAFQAKLICQSVLVPDASVHPLLAMAAAPGNSSSWHRRTDQLTSERSEFLGGYNSGPGKNRMACKLTEVVRELNLFSPFSNQLLFVSVWFWGRK